MPSGQKRKARELRDADVGWVSLVPRGANGEPFRVVKSEDGMSIDLAKVFKGAPKAAPAVAFVAIAKGFDLDAAKELIEKSGFSIEDVEDTDNATIFKQNGFDLELDGDRAEMLQLSEAVVVGVVNVDVQKSFDELNFESTSFQEVLQQHGALPMIYTAKMALGDTLHNILRNGGDQGDTIDLVEKAVDDFKGYVSGVLSAVPETAFKMDVALMETPVAKADVETAAKSEETPEDAKTDDASAEDADVEKGGMGKKKPMKDEDEDAEKGGKSKSKKADEDGDDGEAVEKSEGGDEPSDDADQSPALEAMMSSINALAESVNSLSENTTNAIKSVEGKVDEVVGRVEKTETALKGAVPTVLDDAEVAKSEEDDEDEDQLPDFATIDTAFGKPFGSE